MAILREIREGFASMQPGNALKVQSLPEECPAYIIRLHDSYGVAIPISEEVVVKETFHSCRFCTGLISIDKTPSNYLMLISEYEEYRHEFASLCAELVAPGEQGVARKALLEDPVAWWKRWRELVGTDIKVRTVYSVIAEMMVLEHRLGNDPFVEWTAARAGSRDIECADEICEVKSTCKRYGVEVTFAGEHQLDHKKPLYLYFLRMEESVEGMSINDMKQRLVNAGYDAGKLENELQRQGWEQGASIRDQKYKPLEKRKYLVDDYFPRITKESFKGDRLPDCIKHIVYTVDLSSLAYTTW